MAIPIISWRNISDSSVASLADFGTVDAGSSSAVLQFYLFNNFAGSSIVSNCESAKLTIKSNTGGISDSVVVSEKWSSARCESASETNYTQIGGTYNSGTSAWDETALSICADYSSLSGAVVSATQPSTGLVDGLIWVKTSALGNSTYRYNLGTTTFVQIYEISGAINTGAVATSKANFIKISLRNDVPSASLAGTYSYKTRLRYSFV